MKRLLFAVLIILFTAGFASAQQQYLCAEAQPGVATYNLKIDGGTVIEGLPFVSFTSGTVDWHGLYDVGSVGAGEHTFEVQAVDVSGWEGPWTNPFVARRPSASANLKILKNL